MVFDRTCRLTGQKCAKNAIYEIFKEEKKERSFNSGVLYTTVCIQKCVCNHTMFVIKDGYCVNRAHFTTNQQITASTITINPRINMVSGVYTSINFF